MTSKHATSKKNRTRPKRSPLRDEFLALTETQAVEYCSGKLALYTAMIKHAGDDPEVLTSCVIEISRQALRLAVQRQRKWINNGDHSPQALARMFRRTAAILQSAADYIEHDIVKPKLKV